MIDRLKAWLTQQQEDLAGSRDELQLAVAALLIEAAQVDARFDQCERAVVERLLERRFALSAEHAGALIRSAQRQTEWSAQLFGFARIVNGRLSRERRIELIEMLWEVAYADGLLDPLEDSLLRRIGGLIDVPDRERGAARLRVACRLGLAART